VSESVRRRAVVFGDVQGVFFRDSCRFEAERLGLGGWVRNRPDGTVEIEVEGSPEAVDSLLAWARLGPPRARVEGVAVEDREPVGDDGFRVR
jgi:acylphosphatase